MEEHPVYKYLKEEMLRYNSAYEANLTRHTRRKTRIAVTDEYAGKAQYEDFPNPSKPDAHTTGVDSTSFISPANAALRNELDTAKKSLEDANSLIEEYQSGSTYKKGQESVLQALLEMDFLGTSFSASFSIEELVSHLRGKINKQNGI